jgi:hypothetical protein
MAQNEADILRRNRSHAKEILLALLARLALGYVLRTPWSDDAETIAVNGAGAELSASVGVDASVPVGRRLVRLVC